MLAPSDDFDGSLDFSVDDVFGDSEVFTGSGDFWLALALLESEVLPELVFFSDASLGFLASAGFELSAGFESEDFDAFDDELDFESLLDRDELADLLESLDFFSEELDFSDSDLPLLD